MALNNSIGAACLNDESFGPSVVGCRDNFDFTRTFEQSILSIAPSVVMIVIACARLFYLSRQPIVVHGGQRFRLLKLTAIGVFVGIQIALVAIASKNSGPGEPSNIAAAVLALCASLVMIPASLYEHSRSLKPSTYLSIYLLFTIIFDVARTRTQWLSYSGAPFTKVFTASMATKIGLLLLESQHKTRWIAAVEGPLKNPELTSGIFSQSLYFWLNRLISRGYRSNLTSETLYGLDKAIGAERHMDDGRSGTGNSLDKRSKPRSLLTKTLWVLKGPFLAPIVPRIALGGFTFSQPFLINALLSYLQQSPDTSTRNVGYGLIGASAVIYTGIAISTGLYWRAHQRALCKLRAYLVVAVYQKLTSKRAQDEKNTSAITLMNSDIMGIQGGFRDLHELWASVIETAVASWLLYRQLGPAFLVPIIIVLICTGLTISLGKFTGKRFRESMQILQQRIGLSSAVIPNLIAIKAAAMAGTVGALLQGYRVQQIDAMKRFRILTTVSTILAFAPILLSPVVTFSISMGSMTIAKVFTSLAWIHLLCHPMTQLLQSVPQILAASTSFSRVQDFLESESHVDNRSAINDENLGVSGPDSMREAGEKLGGADQGSATFIRTRGCSLGWKQGDWVLENIDLSLPQSRFTLVLGPVASGKSTLCKALLGEVPFLDGCIGIRQPNPKTSYCDQDPMLFNTTIRDNIIGFDTFNGPWYEEVVRACHLVEDFASLPAGDHTQVGSKGSALSGGQRKRIALARAIYACPDFAVLDDPLGGLDSKTEQLVARDVFGPSGIFRQKRTTVFLAAQAVRHFKSVDQVLVVREKGVAFQGTLRELRKTDLGAFLKAGDLHDGTVDNSSPNAAGKEFNAQPSEQKTDTTAPFPQGGLTNYRYYFSSMGLPLLALYLILTSCFSFLFSFSAVWLNFWTESNQNDERRTGFYLGIYFMLQIMCLCTLALDVWWLGNVMGPKAGLALHLRTLKNLLRAPLRYYTTVDSSVTTGYFSQDMSLIDGELNSSFGNAIRTGLVVVGQAAVIATASPYLLVGYPVLLAVFFCVQKVYLRTSTQLRHLVLESKNPLYKHFIETVDGLLTIRAFGWTQSRIQLNGDLLDESQRPSYLLAMLQQWLNLVLNLCVACIAVIVTALATQLRTKAGFTGVALVSLMSFGEMAGNWIRCYTELQTATAALSRLRGFENDVPGEDEQDELALGTCDVPEEWPSEGGIELSGVTASYDSPRREQLKGEGGKLMTRALRGISLSISPGERVLVCGRTGSGKSSLLLLIQGFLLPSTGSIRIDGVPLHAVPRSLLRDRIISLPQTPFFIPNNHTFRENLEFHDDSNNSFLHDGNKANKENTGTKTPRQDKELEHALRAVGLWDVVVSQGGLDAEMHEEALSRGQNQLFSLARAIVRARLRRRSEDGEAGKQKGGLLLLDEYNARLDDETDEAMWRAIVREFEGYTIICVAHRMRFVEEYDKVVVMGGGEIMEVGAPGELLVREGGRLRELAGGHRGTTLGRGAEGG
ncbi:putative ABC multidrug transporter [Cercophora newfieldiana]|uniref:ABC multidrug transporter n=1 Tax=Cercophora newfieldiana TaxID=92897 RepID=A0AA39YBQ5_9PEZI|nr:putative ABC multidrug transporter [Cercophora newfieldiana]